MIPVKLELRNFLAYREPGEIDLSGIHLACLAGANGAGKSSILDAITWVLWGKARARRDDALIHGDEEEMHVKLVFALEGNTYRVLRYRTRKGRGNSLLDIEIQAGEEWRSISEATIRATQDKITRLLRLDYETFINSAFLIQGRADEFTQKTPGDRKAILGEILGLNVWADYEEQVKATLKEINAGMIRIDTDLDRTTTELNRADEYQAELAEARQILEDLLEQVQEASGNVQRMEDIRHRRDMLRARESDIQHRITRDESDIRQIHDDWQAYSQRLEDYKTLLTHRTEIEENYQQLVSAREIAHILGEKLMALGSLRERVSSLQNRVHLAENNLNTERRALLARQTELQKQIDDAQSKTDSLAEAQERLIGLQTRKEERENSHAGLADLRETRAALDATNRSLKMELDGLKAQREQILATSEPTCPLCFQDLSETHRAELLENLEVKGQEKAIAYRSNQEQINSLDANITRHQKEIERADAELRGLPPLQDHITRLTEQLEQASTAQESLLDVMAHLEQIENMLESGEYAQAEQEELAQIEEEMSQLGYDRDAHQQARNDTETYSEYESRKTDLDRVLIAMPEAEQRLSQLENQAKDKENRVAQDREILEALLLEITELDGQVSELQQWQAELNNLRDEERKASYRVGAAEQKLNSLVHLENRQAQLIAERNRLADELGVFQELRVAFGKDGIPAMLIEAAIPEIENESNEILSRMTDGRMHIRFDTQREKVTGGTKETLDILIADELGTRDYENFSGGETFRVNFAIRLALSRLLARRAGAQLRTLIIDEGFGTQDAQGRERLVQAINTIKDDFDLILVITHIDELKEAFPARIEITKTREGSQIEIV